LCEVERAVLEVLRAWHSCEFEIGRACERTAAGSLYTKTRNDKKKNLLNTKLDSNPRHHSSIYRALPTAPAVEEKNTRDVKDVNKSSVCFRRVLLIDATAKPHHGHHQNTILRYKSQETQ
jgi:hypothetical protein